MAHPRSSEPLVGAIRWDAWFEGNARPGLVDPSLYDDYSYREPVYGWFETAVPHQDEIIDQQIQYAVDGLLDFWAFVWYPDERDRPGMPPLNGALKSYMRSKLHHALQFCLILQTGWVAGKIDGHASQWRSTFVPEFIALIRDEQYVKVEGNRPLVFWMDTENLDDPAKEGFGPLWQDELYFFAAACIEAGFGKPYLVDMRHDYKSAAKYGFDGVSDYGPASLRTPGHFGFDKLMQHDRNKMEANHDLKVLPGISAAIDPRPRHNEAWTKAVGASYYGFSYELPTFSEWTSHLRETFDWLAQHPDRTCDPPIVAIYSWNELDEGGAGIVPTRQEGTLFLDGIRAAKTGDLPLWIEDRINDSNPYIDYSGDWKREFPVQGAYCNDFTWSDRAGDSFEFSFTGEAVALIGYRGPEEGILAIEIDGKPVASVDLWQDRLSAGEVWIKLEGLSHDRHRLKVVIVEREGSMPATLRCALDCLIVYQLGDRLIPQI